MVNVGIVWRNRWRLKSCPRCGRGDLYLSKDEEGRWVWVCVQCSYEITAALATTDRYTS